VQALTLRYPRPEDAAAIHAAVVESRTELSPWMPWCHADYGRADTLMWIEAVAAGRRNNTAHEFCIFDAGGHLLGSCGINGIQLDYRLANLGYWVRSSATGEGVATSASRQLVDWTFANTPVHRLEIIAAVGNLKSRRVAEKLGAEREGILRHRLLTAEGFTDAVLYSIINEQESSAA
jgi:RimJ/RimL family protein N-acetyltransferase